MKEYNLSAYEENKCTFFSLGRNAMYAVCKILDLKPGDEALTPAYDCDGALQPFKVLGLRISFYKSDPYSFQIDINDIKKRINKKSKLVHIINHFGFSQPWDKLLGLRREIGIPILEDNAYSLFSSYDGKPFGMFGDFSIFSLRKNLPFIGGGILKINNNEYSFNLGEKSAPFFYKTEIGSILSAVRKRIGIRKMPNCFMKYLSKVMPEVMPPPPLFSDKDGYPQCDARDKIGKEFLCNYLRPMSKLARFQLSNYTARDFSRIAGRKRQYYLFLAEKLKDSKGIRILWPELPEGTVPFCLNILVESNRDTIYTELRKKYDVMVWPTLSKMVLDNLKEYPEVELLGRRLLQINLPPDRIGSSNFSGYINNLVKDLNGLILKYGI